MKNLSNTTNDFINDFLMEYNNIGMEKSNLRNVATLIKKAESICMSDFELRKAICDDDGQVNYDKILNMVLSVDEWKSDKSLILGIINGPQRAKLSCGKYTIYNHTLKCIKSKNWNSKALFALACQYTGNNFASLSYYQQRWALGFISNYISSNENTFESAEKLHVMLNEMFNTKNSN